MQTALEKLATLLIRRRFGFAWATFVVTLVGAWLAQGLSFQQSIEALYSPNDPQLQRFLSSKRTFGGDEFVLVAYPDAQLMAPEGLARVRALADRLNQIPGVAGKSTQNVADALAPPDLPFALRLMVRTQAERLTELFEGILIGKDRETTAIVLRLTPESKASIPRADTFARIRAVAAAHKPRAYVVGEPVQVHDMFRYVEQDGGHLFRVSLSVLALVIYVMFRSLRWVILPLLVVIVTIISTEALLVLTQMQLSMVSSMLTSLVTIIGVATVTHIAIHYRDARLRLEPEEALRQTLIALSPAVFWTCATTAVGFGALVSSDITPVRSFGIMMALASMVVLAAVATVLPTGVLLGRAGSDPSASPSEAKLTGILAKITWSIERHARWYLAGAVSMLALAAVGFTRLEVETDFSRNFRADSDIVKSLSFVETRLGGAGTWEVNFPAPAELTEDYLDQVRDLAERLRALTEPPDSGLTKVVAITDVLDMIPTLPFVKNSLQSKLDQVSELQPEFVDGLYNPSKGRMRLVLRARERQPSEQKLEMIKRVEAEARKTFSEADATGTYVLLTYLIHSLLRDQLVSFALATAGIFTMMSIAFGGIQFGLISLVPNLFPIVIVVGALGWTGLPVNIGTAMIASVSMGLTTDSSVHYLRGYRVARLRGASAIEAVRETHSSVGLAILFATLALVIGFSVLTLSQFVPLIYFGGLVSLAMAGGLAGSLFLLPAILIIIDAK